MLRGIKRFVIMFAMMVSLLTSCKGGSEDNTNLILLILAAGHGPGWLPSAPNVSFSGPQGVQNDLFMSQSAGGFRLATTGQSPRDCSSAGVTIAMWSHAVCYGNTNGKLYCAGQIGSRDFGLTFSDAQIPDSGYAKQLLGSPKSNHELGNSLCALMDSGKAWCLGYGGRNQAKNFGVYWGQFRTSDNEEPGSVWKQWGTRSDIVELATGTSDGICGRYADSSSDCVGLTCGFSGQAQACFATPGGGQTYSAAAATPHSSTSSTTRLWVDTFGMIHRNEQDTFRAANSHAACIVVQEGFVCHGGGEDVVRRGFFFGKPETSFNEEGHVVDGMLSGGGARCWLTDAGTVSCKQGGNVVQHFASGKVLALAANMYTATGDLCAVYNDGSVWCKGANTYGQFGSGNTAALETETQVQPPGSARIACSQ